MANSVYPLFRTAALQGARDVLDGTLSLALLTAGAYNPSHEFFSALSAALVGPVTLLSGVTVVGGVVDASDTTVPLVPIGSTVIAAALILDTGTPATSPLVLWIDEDTDGPLSIPTNGGNIVFEWGDGINKIFAI
jgi:hypothetical protein